MAGQEKPKVPQEQEKWYFTKEQLQNSPSRRCGLDADKELAYRQQAANLIQDMGQRLQVSQLCINTAIVYMHRFYAFHSFTQFHRNAIAAAALFLAAKVEEQPRKLEYVIRVAHVCLHRGESVAQLTTEQYQEQAQDLVFNENVLLQTLGFDVAIDHPHTHVVRTCHLVKAPKDLAQTSYFMASNSLHLTTMCLQYRPTVVACFCIHLASKWSNWAIPQSNEGRHWFSYVDRSVSLDLLERLTAEFLHIFDKCPSRLKKKMKTMSNNSGSSPAGAAASPFDKKHAPPNANDDFDKSFDREYEREKRRAAVLGGPGGYVPAAAPSAPPAQAAQPAPSAQPAMPQPPQKIDYTVYREKREREERERREERDRRQQMAQRSGQPQPRPNPAAPNPAHRPNPAQTKPGWPQHPHHKMHHKPHDKEHKEHKLEHKEHKMDPNKIDHRHHRPVPTASTSSAPNPPITPEMPQRTRPPSLFSPENVTAPSAAVSKWPQNPPQRPRPVEKPPSPKKRPEPTIAEKIQPPTIISPFPSPPIKEKQRQRAPSNSEPELVPVVKKLDETPGYENVLRDSQRGNSIRTKPQEPKPPRALNGIETDPTLVSNLLKESLAKPAPITVQTEKRLPIEREVKKEPPPPPVIPEPVVVPKTEPVVIPTVSVEEPEHKHKKEKKKKEKHKHKDRDKSKEERKKHKKDKEREKKKEPSPQAPAEDGIRITIPRDKLSSSQGLKITIPKERLAQPPPPPQGSGLKIKISKEVLETSRKRSGAQEIGPPNKMQRQNGAPKVEGSLQ